MSFGALAALKVWTYTLSQRAAPSRDQHAAQSWFLAALAQHGETGGGVPVVAVDLEAREDVREVLDQVAAARGPLWVAHDYRLAAKWFDEDAGPRNLVPQPLKRAFKAAVRNATVVRRGP